MWEACVMFWNVRGKTRLEIPRNAMKSSHKHAKKKHEQRKKETPAWAIICKTQFHGIDALKKNLNS